jgi:predicted lipoprotein with Yx(FWY)xxD motif
VNRARTRSREGGNPAHRPDVVSEEPMIRTPVLPLAALAVAAAFSVGACGTTSSVAGTPSPAPTVAYVQAAAPAPPGPALTASPTDALGTVVVDGTGFTLYRFDKDKPKPSKSTCVGKCADTWPPVLADSVDAVKLDGVDRAAVGSVKRADGTLQLTIGGWPVYRYSGDKQAGDTAGEGIGKTWFAVTPAGKKALPAT